jgi:glycosyltransferase involved in cell wall biosynthesis
MKVSIIVPVYNVEKYIQRCFDSVSAQTYKDIECIFVDDSTPDNCNELLKAMISTFADEKYL